MISINSSYIGIIVCIVLLMIIRNRNNAFYLRYIKRKKEGRERKMPKELIKEFIGKVCSLVLYNESFGFQGKIVAVEDNWIKVDEKGKIKLINGDMIRDISILPEKYQK